MNLITALEIYTNHPNGDILITSAQHKETNKFTSLMYLMRNGHIHKLMLSFDINEKFSGWDKEEDAIKEMEKIRNSAIQYCKENNY